MNTDIRLQGLGDDLLTGVPHAGAGDNRLDDYLKDVRRVKRLTQFGVYAAIIGTLPVYYFALGFAEIQLLVVLVVGLVIATGAIEGAFAEMFKLRKRSAYPGAVALHLGALPTFDAACQAMASIVRQLLHVRGSFLTLRDESGFLALVSLSNVSRVDADRYLRLGAAQVNRVISEKHPVALHPSEDLLAEAIISPGQQIVFVPVQSFRKVVGVLGLLASDTNRDLRDGELIASLGVAIGVSLESLRQRDELRTLAAIDELTKVYNRRYFFDHLEREVAAARRYSMPLAVLIFDLDGLKELNDGFGHDLGDEALRTLAQRLVRHSRASDIVARLGGDEFALILPRTDCAGAAEFAQRLQDAVESETLIATSGREVKLAVSCGFASFPEDAEDVSVLIRQADGRMYAAKAARQGSRRRGGELHRR